MLEQLGGRKFLMGLITIIAGAAVHILSQKGLTTEFVALLLGVTGSFSVTNLMATNSALKHGVTSSSVDSDPLPPSDKIESLDQSLDTQASQDGEEMPPNVVQLLHKKIDEQAKVTAAMAQSVANTNKLLVAALNATPGAPR